MIKILLVILVTLLAIAFGYSMLKPDEKSIKLPGSESTNLYSPTDALEGAKDAVGQSQNVQDKLNQQAQDQLNQ